MENEQKPERIQNRNLMPPPKPGEVRNPKGRGKGVKNRATPELRGHQLGAIIRIESKNVIAGAMIETLAASVKLANKEMDTAFKIYQSALKIHLS